MFKDYSGRIWENEEKYKQYKNNVRKYMSRSLAVEHYADYMKDESIYKSPAFVKLKEYRTNKSSINSERLLLDTADLVNLFDELIKTLGIEKFYVNEDGSVNFIWPKINED